MTRVRWQDVEQPTAIAALPTDKIGHPIPWFVHRDEAGVPDFRVVRRGGIEAAYRFGWCWICGRNRGRHAAFVIGPMCAVNRVSPEPPSHLECALYAARACPFLTSPKMVRRDSSMPEGAQDPAGTFLRRNPGVALVWSSRSWKPFRAPGGVLFDVGDPSATRWLAEGREATRDEVLAAIDSGLPLLRAEAEPDGDQAVRDLEVMHAAALHLVPA